MGAERRRTSNRRERFGVGEMSGMSMTVVLLECQSALIESSSGDDGTGTGAGV